MKKAQSRQKKQTMIFFKHPIAAILFLLILVVLVGLMGKFGSHQQISFSPTTSINPKISLRDILKKDCQSRGSDGFPFISPDKLPFNVDQRILSNIYIRGNANTKKVFECEDEGFLDAWLNPDSSEIWINDEKSAVKNHIKNPENLGYKFYQKDGTNLFIKLVMPSGGVEEGHGPAIKYLWTEIYGIRTIKIKNGETLYISFSENGPGYSDARFLTFMNKFATPASVFDGNPEIDKIYRTGDTREIEKAIAGAFFADLNNLAKPEKNEINRMLEVLNAFKPL